MGSQRNREPKKKKDARTRRRSWSHRPASATPRREPASVAGNARPPIHRAGPAELNLYRQRKKNQKKGERKGKECSHLRVVGLSLQ